APDEITNQLMREEVEKADSRGFVLDGYPRNQVQLEAMKKFAQPTHVFLINIPEEESIRRIAGRRICDSCGADYNIYTKPPKQDEICDKCGARLHQRHDDHPDGVKQRLKIYHNDTEPLLKYFEEQDILRKIDGLGTVDQVFERVITAFQ
ncbi:MAG TPA: nucleoside monophosphate kinase, partial [Patescibacteria group bacterium]